VGAGASVGAGAAGARARVAETRAVFYNPR
jgi:hypothetical protein